LQRQAASWPYGQYRFVRHVLLPVLLVLLLPVEALLLDPASRTGHERAGHAPETQYVPPPQSPQAMGMLAGHPALPPPSSPAAASGSGHATLGQPGLQNPPPLHPVQYVWPSGQPRASVPSVVPSPPQAPNDAAIHTRATAAVARFRKCIALPP
jgi:hypothetical protein